uniref:Uncharacterized protein n=1 Tax=Candidatus Kentrum sp. LFY TaxID=2126342 RepID=A0A450U958_9GAMM|nr:MAG: hypothetical protein BECKLFY1418B_GA0070995_101110 [Candidatus Kentron sp. LFY]VFJ92535.1 MAG: hypothetical protein BECKLFY1418A_GA0070994_102410 [Candidatus Kentron sp. LFY]VFK12631.1 MAG: hypothetical protein BECKLFY1418C_GA0070996_100129 [Candidatus Kentron sp. LFY]
MHKNHRPYFNKYENLQPLVSYRENPECSDQEIPGFGYAGLLLYFRLAMGCEDSGMTFTSIPERGVYQNFTRYCTSSLVHYP